MYQEFSEPLYPYIKPTICEVELIKSKPVRRLKQLAHFGVGSLFSPVVHSRFEHTIGVWKLTASFYPKDIELRIAALLHDIGHLPFSHAVEETLGFNHHELTEQYIQEEEVSSILKKFKIDPQAIIRILNEDSVLTGKGNILGIDHLDSFFRDTYMSGTLEILPKHLITKINCTPAGIDTDIDTGLYLLQLILSDHNLFLSPHMVAVDRLLAEAIKLHWDTIPDKGQLFFPRLTDSDVLAMLTASKSNEAKKLINIILYKPDNIRINNEKTGKGYQICVREVYDKIPTCNGKPLTEYSKEAKVILHKLSDLSFDLEVVVES